MSFPPQTDLKPRLTVKKLITSPVFSPTLLQIYCIGLIGLIFYSFLVWATICDPTKTINKQIQQVPLKKKKNQTSEHRDNRSRQPLKILLNEGFDYNIIMVEFQAKIL